MVGNSETLRVGIVGLGMGKSHVAKFREDPNCEVVALCDIDEDRLKQQAEALAVPKTYRDAQELFDSGEVDVVSVATPNTLHAPLTMAALNAGLHVLCEKPMAMNADQAREMVETAEKCNRKLSMHFNHRMNEWVQLMRDYVASGDLGDIYYARTFWHRRKGIPGRPSFLSKQNAGGGAMIDLGVHMLDSTLFLMGYPAVKTVSAMTYKKFHDLDVPDIDMDVDDFAISFIRLENGVTLEMEISWASHHDEPEQRLIQLYGTEGGALRRLGGEHHVDCSIMRREHGALVKTHPVRPKKLEFNAQTDLLDAIRNDREPQCSAKHGLVTMVILDALYESSRQGREIVLSE